MEISLDFTDPSDRPKRRDPPPRFAAMAKAKESVPLVEQGNKTDKSAEHLVIRKIRSPLYKDADGQCTLDDAIAKLAAIYPDFISMKETIDTDPDWKKKVSAVNTFAQFMKDSGKLHFAQKEAAIVFAMSFSRNFKAANINILKCSLNCVKTIVESCGAGPHIVSTITSALLPKIHDKKLSGDISDLLMLCAEGVGPDVIINALVVNMSSSRIPAQQVAVLSVLLRLINEFGANSVNLKDLLSYVQGEKGLLSTNPEVKKRSIELVCALHRQLGSVVRTLIEQCGLNDLLLKSVMTSLDEAPFDPELAKKYSASSSKSQGVGEQSSTAPLTSLSLSDLVTASDISGDVVPLLRAMQDMDGKDSWKRRQQAVMDLMGLLKQKVRVVNNKAIGDVISVLKDRLSESNLNFRARVLQCVGQLAEAVGVEITRYNASMVNDMMKLCNDSNKNVIESLYNALTSWTIHDRTSCINSVLPHLVQGLRSVKGRAAMLRWLVPLLPHTDARSLTPLIPDFLDCLLDRTQEVRVLASQAFKTIGAKCGRAAVEDRFSGRKPADVLSLQSILEPILADCKDTAEPSKPSQLQEASLDPKNKSADATTDNKSKLTDARRQALANRPGARVLSKRPASSAAATMKRQAISSIPKPLPPLKQRGKQSSPTNPPVIVVPAEPAIRQETVDEKVVMKEEEESRPSISHQYLDDHIQLPTPRIHCEGWVDGLVKRTGTLLTKAELESFHSEKQVMNVDSEFVSFHIGRFGTFLKALRSFEHGMKLFEQYNNQYCQVIESCAEICWICGSSSIEVIPTPTDLNSNELMGQLSLYLDSILSVACDLLSTILFMVDVSSEKEMTQHLINVVSSLLKLVKRENITSFTVNKMIKTFVMGLSQSDILDETPSIRFLFHQLFLQLIDSVFLPTLLLGLVLYMEQESNIDPLVLLLDRVLQRIRDRANNETKSSTLTDEERKKCVDEIKQHLPPHLPATLRSDVNICVTILEPVVSTSSMSFAEILRSANQMLSSSPASSEFTATRYLRNQLGSIRQQHEARKSADDEKVDSEAVPKIEKTEEEKDKEERMRRIREEMSKM